MEKKLCISLIFSNFVVSKHKVIIFHAMHVTTQHPYGHE